MSETTAKKATAGKAAPKRAAAGKTAKKATAGKAAPKRAAAGKTTATAPTLRATSATSVASPGVPTSAILGEAATRAVLRSIQVPNYSELFKGVQLPDYSQLFKGVQLPDYSQLFKGVQLPDYSQLFKTIQVPDYAQLVGSVTLPAQAAALGSIGVRYDQLVAKVVLPQFSTAVDLPSFITGKFDFRDLLPELRTVTLALGALVDQPLRSARTQASALAPAIAHLAGDVGRRLEEGAGDEPRPDSAGAGRRGGGRGIAVAPDEGPVTLGDLYIVMTEMLLVLDAIQDGQSSGPSTVEMVNTVINTFMLLLTIATVLIAL
jgi:hypothetical protein